MNKGIKVPCPQSFLPAHSQQFPIANASFARSMSFSVCVKLDNFSITP